VAELWQVAQGEVQAPATVVFVPSSKYPAIGRHLRLVSTLKSLVLLHVAQADALVHDKQSYKQGLQVIVAVSPYQRSLQTS